ncbi:MAG: TerB N-terminal domain-containing protein [Flavobacterium sp.]
MNKDSTRFYTDQNIADNVDGKKVLTSKLDSQNWDYVPPIKPASSSVWSDDVFSKEIVADTPQMIIDLAKMSRQEPWLLTRNKSFFEQALYMADYEDDVQIVPFFEYFPVYRSMNITQLRSYFTFRTLLRKDQYPDVSLSYIFVYIYEILMQVGVKNPHQGLGILQIPVILTT